MRRLFLISFSLLSSFLFSFENFPEGKHKNLVLQKCILCHTVDLVSSQALSKKNWDKTLSWMEKNHNLYFEDKEEREKILTYLAKHFGEKSSQEEAPMGIRPVNPLPSLQDISLDLL